jgi:hypothetical protein
MAMVSLIVLMLMVLLVVFGPLVWKVAINDIDFTARLEGPSLKHPFGTDDLGQDVLARMLYGGRISLAVGLAAMLMAISGRGDRCHRWYRARQYRRGADVADGSLSVAAAVAPAAAVDLPVPRSA